MGNGNYSSQPFLSKNTVDGKRKEASGASEDGNGGLQRVGSQETEGKQGRYQNGEEGIREEGEHCTEQLKKDPETPEEKVRRHQNNPCKVKELTQRIRVLFENGGEKRPSRTKYLTGGIERGYNTVTDVTSILFSNGSSSSHSPSYTTPPFR